MFEGLSEKLERSFKVLKGQAYITEVNIADTMKEIRRALLDADVSYKIGVPASNRAGGTLYSVRSIVTSFIMFPPPCHGCILSNSSLRPYTTPMPLGP